MHDLGWIINLANLHNKIYQPHLIKLKQLFYYGQVQ